MLPWWRCKSEFKSNSSIVFDPEQETVTSSVNDNCVYVDNNRDVTLSRIGSPIFSIRTVEDREYILSVSESIRNTYIISTEQVRIEWTNKNIDLLTKYISYMTDGYYEPLEMMSNFGISRCNYTYGNLRDMLSYLFSISRVF